MAMNKKETRNYYFAFNQCVRVREETEKFLKENKTNEKTTAFLKKIANDCFAVDFLKER